MSAPVPIPPDNKVSRPMQKLIIELRKVLSQLSRHIERRTSG